MALGAATILPVGTASAQVAGETAPPPVRRSIDENGVDVIRGTFVASVAGISIGGGGTQGLSYGLLTTGVTTTMGTIVQSGATYIVTIDGQSDSFTLGSGVFTSTEGQGATLVLVDYVYTYTSSNGTKAVFDSNNGYFYPFKNNELARLRTVEYPDGSGRSVTFKVQTFCRAGYEYPPACAGPIVYVARIQSVTNNHGYQLKFSYASNATELTGPDFPDWSRVAQITAINNGSEYCSASADTCTLSGNWPKLTFGASGSVTDAAGRTTTYSSSGVTAPGGSSIQATVTSGKVSSVTNAGVARSYAYSDSGTTRTTTTTDAKGGQRVYVASLTTFLMSSFRDEANRTTNYLYDSKGRVTEIIQPEGNTLKYTYDARGNATETRLVSKTPGTPADIVTSAAFDATCVNVITCNQPNSTTDAMGAVTDYGYDAAHGGVLTVTAPAPTTGAVRPQARYSYAPRTAYYRTGASPSVPVAGAAITKLTAMSMCQTLASCAGQPDEVKTTADYGPQVSGTANNLLPIGVSSGSGDGVLTATTALGYDVIGNRLTVDGPLPGAEDTTRVRYDALRRAIGVIGPDPDGAAGLLHRAERVTYNPNGGIDLAEAGTVTNQTDAAWAAFASLQQVATGFDANARPVRQELRHGGTTYSVGQTSYDTLGRIDCTVQRMNPAQWASQTDACVPQTGGPQGADRVTQTLYTAASQVARVRVGVGTSDFANDRVMGYTENGLVGWVRDGENNRTAFVYDEFDRFVRTRFPVPTQGADTSSTTDFERLFRDANGNVVQRLLRGGASIFYSYDALNRPTRKDLPGNDPDVSYGYDLLGRVTNASITGNAQTFGYDALGRLKSRTGPLGTLTYAYDLAGRRTRMTWPDTFYVGYDHLVTGEMTAVRENGAVSGVGVLASYAYDNLGRRTALTRGNGTNTLYSYAGSPWLTGLTLDLAGSADDQNLTFAYNAAGQVVTTTRSNDGYAWVNPANRNDAATLNGLNQATQVGASTLTHDAKGNVSAIGADAYSYDSENRMKSAKLTTFSYDPLGNIATLQSGALRLAYDGTDLIAEYDVSGPLLTRHVFGAGVDEPLVYYDASGARRFEHADERGSIVAITDSAGARLSINRYDEYGVPASGNVGRFQYTGQSWLPGPGLYYYKARMYAPALGRFLQPDPVGYDAGMNLYAYVGGDPVNASDPSGTITDALYDILCKSSCTGASYLDYMNSTQYRSTDGRVISALDFKREAYDAGGYISNSGGHSSLVILSNAAGYALGVSLAAAAGANSTSGPQNVGLLAGDHDYTAGPNLICPASWGCSASLVGSVYSQVSNAVPGNTSAGSVVSGNSYTVRFAGVPVGEVQSYVGSGGLTINNITQWDHVLAQGYANRNAYQSGGSWYSVTHGSGTNYYGGAFMAVINQLAGPGIFNSLDQSIAGQLYNATHH